MDVHHDRAARREQIKAAIIADPHRSNRDIARMIGVDHKTVGAVRGRMYQERRNAKAEPPPLGNFPHTNSSQVGSEETPQVGNSDPGEFSWSDIPDSAYVVPAQGHTAAYIEGHTGDLIIAQDRSHLRNYDAITRINVFEVRLFVDSLVEMAKRHT